MSSPERASRPAAQAGRVPGLATGAACGLLLAGAFLSPLFGRLAVPTRLDLADFFWPMKVYTALRWGAGGLPLWNPLSGCGEPWLAQLQSGVLYPPDFLFLLPMPWSAWAALLFHFALAAAGMAAYLRDLGTSRAAAAAGAGLFVASGTFVSLVPVLNNAWTAAWLPWVFLAARRAATGGSGAGLALSAAAAFLAGEPLLAAAGTAGAVVLALATRREDAPRSRRAFSATGAAILLAAGTACAVAWPFADLVARTGRLGNVLRSEALARPVMAGEIGDLVAPPLAAATFRREPSRGGYLVSLATSPLLLVLVAGAGAGFPGRRRLLALLLAGGALAFLLALGARGGLLPLLRDAGLLPGVRFPARWFVFTHLALCIAAAAGWDGWTRGASPADDPEGRRERRVARLAAGVAAALLAGAGICALATAQTRDPLRAAVAGAATLAGILLLLRLRRRGPSPLGEASLLLVLLAPLPLLAYETFDGTPAALVLSTPPAARGIAGGRVFTAGSDRDLLAVFSEREGRWDPGAPLRAHALLAGYANLTAGIPSATSASPVRDVRVSRVLGSALAGGGDPTAVFALTDVRHLLTPFPARIPGARLVLEANGVLRYTMPAGAGRFFFPREARFATDDEVLEALRRPGLAYDETAWVAAADVSLPPARGRRGWSVGRLVLDEPEKTEIHTSCSDPGLLVLTRSFDAGWRATVDDVPATLLRVDLAFAGLAVPAGEHRVSLVYAPRSWTWGRWISALSLLLTGVLYLAAPPRTAP